MNETMTLDTFLTQHRITMTTHSVRENPFMDNSQSMNHWKCRLRCGRNSMTVYFSKGYGHRGAEPTLPEVLDCLASDAADYDNASSFDEWCDQYGFDADSRKVEKTWKTIGKQRDNLERLLGPSAYEALLNDTERM